ncbi:SEL1-like repeat protein [Niastella sp. OAS944]|uniref:SEL1-like repeat protein n=1 Tax=Niastella sp. OAS944 TaxID=2664089 RepID=UPI00347DE51D|nr:TPR repeat protein [Chitinophagaceae bacterium OAS944]
MSHRMYLYNVNVTENRRDQEPNKYHELDGLLPVVASNESDVLMMMEWKYEFPLFLHPLFAGEPFLAPPMYNGTLGGLYANAFLGKAALMSFYSFIDRHAEVLTDNPKAFRASMQKIYSFLENKAVYNSFHLDAWDVFNMSDDPHEAQATELLNLIKATNDCIKAAIEADAPALLNNCPGVRDSPYGFTSFSQLFSHSAYGYGWEVIRSGYFEEEEDPEEEIVFTENGLEGLKKKDGTVIIPAQYDEVYSFPDNETFAVVKRGGKYGYVNREGKLVTGLIYDDAYDVLNGYGRVQIDSQHYLVQPGAELPSTSYDELRVISEEAQWYEIAKGGAKSIINAAGQTLLPFVPCESDRVGTYNGRPLMRITDEIKKGRKTLQFHGLVTAEGQTILEVGYLDIWPAFDDVVIVKAKDHFGMYSVQNGWMLEMEYDRIDPFLDKVYLLQKGTKHGLYIIGLEVVPPVYDMIVSDVNWAGDQEWETFATNGQAAFRINHLGVATLLSSEELEELLVENKRYRYNPHELNHLLAVAGDALPPDMLHAKGFDALSAQDYSAAIKYYTLAADKGNADSMNDLGYIYEAIEGFVDSKRSFEWYTRGVEAGSPHAANGLANCYMDGLGTTADINKAIELYELSAAGNVSYGHYNLGIIYYEGNHVEKNYEKALPHFEQACQLGYECHNYVGVLFEQKEDYKNAYKAYKSGAKYKDPDCAFNLARLHELGHGCKQDPRKALSYYMDSVKWGTANAHLELRRMYLTYDEVRDEKKAMEHEQLAREAGVEIPE